MRDQPNEQSGPVMDGAGEATREQRRAGLHDQTALDHPGDPEGADRDQALREHESGIEQEFADGDAVGELPDPAAPDPEV